MAKNLNALLSAIRDSEDYDAVQKHLTEIKAKQAAARDPDVVRALRDAQVYALVWGVFVAVLEQSKLSISYLKGNQAIQADHTDYEDDYGVREALQSVNLDAGAEHPDAIADAAAADMAAFDAQKQVNDPEFVKAFTRSWVGYSKGQDPNSVSMAVTEFVQQAYNFYAKEPVTKAVFVATLKAHLNRYLHINRVTTSGAGGPLQVQGELESIDEKNQTFVLKSTVYKDRRDTVEFSDVMDLGRARFVSPSTLVDATWRNVDLGK